MASVRKKLIEVALPLEAINVASAREKSIRHGHPSTLHLWWARRPLAAARAVIFAQMVDDPSAVPEQFPTPEAQERERRRLFRIIEDLVKWENTTNETVLQQARAEIRRSWARQCLGATRAARLSDAEIETMLDAGRMPALPGFHDPFAGGGSLPLEAQRLGLEAYASDLNPVAVLINKAMIEIPPKFAGRPPVNPESRKEKSLIAREWQGAQGLAEDVRYYGQWMREEAERRIGHLYPKIEVTPEMAAGCAGLWPARPDLKPYVGKKLTVIAWLWVRTVKSPNPAFAHVDVPLASTFMLSTKPGKEAYVEPVILGAQADAQGGARAGARASGPHDANADETSAHLGYRFTVKVGKPKDLQAAKNGTSAGKRAAFTCVMSGTPITYDYIRSEGQAGRMGARLMAIVAEGDRGRVYLAPTPEHEAAALKAKPEWKPEVALPVNPRDFKTPNYGLMTFADLFTPRQLVALTTFSDLVGEAIEKVKADYLGVLPGARAGARASGPHDANADETSAHQGEASTRASGPHSHPHEDANSKPIHSGWHSRGYHPHFDRPGLLQSITFRLADSVPAELLEAWRAELKLAAGAAGDDPRCAELRQRIDRYEDAGHGACWLRDPRIGAIVENALLHYDGERYRLLEWCVMPNHVHVLVETVEGHPLADVVRSWKNFTAREANRLHGREGAFWMADYYDRFVRDEQHLAAVRRYIRENPVKAGLCDRAEAWRFGSAWGERERAGGPRTQDDVPLRDGGTGAQAYAEAVGVYAAFTLSRQANRTCTISFWDNTSQKIQQAFGRQALPMTWDFCESNPFSDSSGNWLGQLDFPAKSLEAAPAKGPGFALQQDAQQQGVSADKVVSTDPPYYDNIGYADLSDFFYVWLRRALKPVFPDLFATLAVPKAEELVATPYRHGSREQAEKFFLDGMTQAMHRLAEQAHPAFPVTIYYAFKQSETLGARASGPHDTVADETSAHPGVASTGWETFLDAVIRAGFAITGTWPMRTEYTGNLKKNVAALASSIVLVCRPRPADAPTATRREFVSALKSELPQALRTLQGLSHALGARAGARASGPHLGAHLGTRASGPHADKTSALPGIAPVDLAQAAIGPGMAVFTRYAKVLDAQGRAMTVREALSLINQVLDEALAEQEGDFDADTRWAVAWFEQMGFTEGEFGVAETLSKAKNTGVSGMAAAGILESRRGKVRLLRPEELPQDWEPDSEPRASVWKDLHHLIRVLETGGESAAAEMVSRLGGRAEAARELAYRLYTICERKKRSSEALAYNAIVQSMPEITRLAQSARTQSGRQQSLFERE